MDTYWITYNRRRLTLGEIIKTKSRRCIYCIKSKSKCDHKKPCFTCIKNNHECKYVFDFIADSQQKPDEDSDTEDLMLEDLHDKVSTKK